MVTPFEAWHFLRTPGSEKKAKINTAKIMTQPKRA
jgi:hypothetical protein